MKRIEHNVETGEITEVTMTDDEIANYETSQKQAEQIVKELAKKEKAAAAARKKLAELGLTAAELDALLG